MQTMLEKKPLLVLFDAHALVHRAYHAINKTRLSVSKTGEPTNAVFGFTQMLLKVLADLKPTHWAIAFDHPSRTFRHEQFVEYKAQRPETPDELKTQLRRVRDLVSAFHIPAFEVPGFEADDILGTLCRQATEQGADTIIVTGDMDSLQLVTPGVRVLTPKPMRPFSDTVLYDVDAVLKRYELPPDKLPDFKGLKGDPSDNIPGVPGIGGKTAARLVQQFGSIEAIYQRIEEVQPLKLRETLRQNEDKARQSRTLATIVCDMPIKLDLNACRVSAYERDKVTELFRELEFFTLLSRLPESLGAAEEAPRPPAKPSGEVAKDYRVVDTPESLADLLRALSAAESFSFDIETDDLDARRARLVGFSFSTSPGLALYVPVGHNAGTQLALQQVIDSLKPVLEDSKAVKVGHNAKYDMTVLQRYGVRVQNVGFDTMIAGYLLGEKALGLKAMVFSKLGIEMTPITTLIGTGKKQVSMAWVDIPKAADYACADADFTLRMRRVLEEELTQHELWKLFAEVEMPLLPILLQIETCGVGVDAERLRSMSREMGQEMGRIEVEIYNAVGNMFNINSPRQLGKILFEDLKLPHTRKTRDGYTTEAAALEELKGAHPVIELLLQYRQIAKLKSTYVDALPDLVDPNTGRLHTSFNQTGTATGRLSSSDPNLQNIPIRGKEGKEIRMAFISGKESHVLLSGDYSQIDLRALAHLSQDPVLLDAFNKNEDVHSTTASQIFGVPLAQVTPDMRRVAKTVNFGVIYGMSEYGLEQATELTREQAGQFIKAYFEKYPGVKKYLDETRKQAREKGYVQTLLGRRRYIPEIKSSNYQVRQSAERMAINMPVQGTSADIIKVAMIRLHEEMVGRKMQSLMILQVHDDLLFEVPETELEELKMLVLEIMPNAVKLSVPLKVDIKTGKSWGEME